MAFDPFGNAISALSSAWRPPSPNLANLMWSGPSGPGPVASTQIFPGLNTAPQGPVGAEGWGAGLNRGSAFVGNPWFGGQSSGPVPIDLGFPSSQIGQGSTGIPSLGGDWANVDRWNGEIAAAQAQVQRETGVLVPASTIKAIMRIESGGLFNEGQGAESPAGARGLMQVTNSTMGNFDYARLAYDAAYGVYAGVKELALRYLDSPGQTWDQAATGYFSGHYIPYGSSDGYNTDYDYLRMFQGYNSQLSSALGTSQFDESPGAPLGAPGGFGANSVVAKAMEYVGKVPYVWGGIPGKGDSPYADGGGWDCSGFTYWLDQNYGNGALPMGSHYQYQYAQQTGQLFMDTSQLRPGDLVWFDTGWMGGAGAELNRAGHVAMYAGDGKMIHAANSAQGTIVSDFASYAPSNGYTFIGAMHMPFSGGAGAGVPTAGGSGFGGTGPGGFAGGNWWDRYYQTGRVR